MKQSGSGDSKSQMDGVKMQGIVVDEVKEQLYLALAKLHSISSSGRPRAPPPVSPHLHRSQSPHTHTSLQPRHYDQQPCGSTSTPTRWPEDDRKIPTAPAPVSSAPSHSDTPLAHLAEAASCCMGVVDCNPPITPMSNIAASTNPDQIQPSQPTFPTRHEFDAAEALRLSTRTIDETKCCLGLIDCDDM